MVSSILIFILKVSSSALLSLDYLTNVRVGLSPDFSSPAGGGEGPFVGLIFNISSLSLMLVLEFIIHV